MGSSVRSSERGSCSGSGGSSRRCWIRSGSTPLVSAPRLGWARTVRETVHSYRTSHFASPGIFLLCIALTFVFAFAIQIELRCPLGAYFFAPRTDSPSPCPCSVLVLIFAIATYLSYACASCPSRIAGIPKGGPPASRTLTLIVLVQGTRCRTSRTLVRSHASCGPGDLALGVRGRGTSCRRSLSVLFGVRVHSGWSLGRAVMGWTGCVPMLQTLLPKRTALQCERVFNGGREGAKVCAV